MGDKNSQKANCARREKDRGIRQNGTDNNIIQYRRIQSYFR